MKTKNILIGILVLGFCIWFLKYSREGFKNVDYDAQNQLEKITTKILPGKAICIRGTQCISGVCLENNNETTYGYCKDPI